jgi:hypothetical protein
MQNHSYKNTFVLCISLLVSAAHAAQANIAFSSEQIKAILAYDISQMSAQDKVSKATELYRLLLNDKVDCGGSDILARLIALLDNMQGWEDVTKDLKDVLNDVHAKNLAEAYRNAGGGFIGGIKKGAHWAQAEVLAGRIGLKLKKHKCKLPKELQREIDCMHKATLTNIIATKLLIG